MPDVPLVPVATHHAPQAMVCTVDHLASAAGLHVIASGGSAADGAIAANAVLAVTSQHLCGMGGDLFAIVHDGSTVSTLDASGRAGSGADASALRSDGFERVPAHDDIRAVTVPGCVDGWTTLHSRFGRIPLAEVLAPAVGYAENGFPASVTLSRSVVSIASSPESIDYLGGRSRLRPGDIVRRPGVARALRAIGEGGRDAWYLGEFGDGLLGLGGDLYGPADLEHHHADWVDPLKVEAWGRTLWTIPPASQGYLTLAASWIAEGLDVPEDPDDPLWAHLLVEAARMAAFDRLDVLHEGADGVALVSPDRLRPRREAIDSSRAADLPGSFRSGGTTYLAAVDGDRMGVSLIQSNAAGFGSGLAVPGVRVFLQNRGIGFSLEAGHPSEYGPRRRPPHTLAPAMVTGPGGGLDTVLGTMGGDSQPQILLQLLHRMLVGGQDPASAIGAGRWALHSATPERSGFQTWDQRGEVTVRLEGNATAGWDAGLLARGHRVERHPAFDHGFGHSQIIRVHPESGMLAGATDPRPRTGAASGR